MAKKTEPIAVVSDIHGNLQALEAVLQDIDARGIKRIFDLGDRVGYLGNPKEVLELAKQRFEESVQGNHENAVILALAAGGKLKPAGLQTVMGFTSDAAKSVIQTAKILKRTSKKGKVPNLHTSTEIQIRPDALGVHSYDGRYHLTSNLVEIVRQLGIPDHLYTHPNEILQDKKLFRKGIRLVLGGHFHVSQAFITKGSQSREKSPDKDKVTLRKGEKAFVGVGSVGKARLQDYNFLRQTRELEVVEQPCLEAEYVILDGNTIEFPKVLYHYKNALRAVRSAKMPIPKLFEEAKRR